MSAPLVETPTYDAETNSIHTADTTASGAPKVATTTPVGVPVAPAVSTSELPGIGTVTVTPKTPLGTGTTAPVDTTMDNSAGLYARTGTAPPPAYTVAQGDTLGAIAQKSGLTVAQIQALNPTITDPNKIQIGQNINLGGGPTKDTPTPTPGTPVVPGLPQYPGTSTDTSKTDVKDAYNKLNTALAGIEAKINSSATPSADELSLQKQLVDAKANLAKFDTDLETRVNAMYGAGRGETLPTINLKDTQERRTSALERLGLAQQAQTLTDQLGLAQSARQNQSAEAKGEYDMATKAFDTVLGVTDEMTKLDTDEQNKARQYLLDVVSFASGKAYNELDPQSQQAITANVANSPITLGMVKTALDSAKEKQGAYASGNLHTVTGVGLVQVDPVTGKHTVVVPENQGGAGSFSPTQINKGASEANVSADVFRTYDPQTQNSFINGGMTASKKLIDAEIKNGSTIDDITTGLAPLNLPPASQKYLTDYAQSQLDAQAPLTPEEFKTEITNNLTSFKTQGYTKDEAKNEIINTLTNSGKTTLPKTQTDAVNSAIEDLYGKSLWERITGQ